MSADIKATTDEVRRRLRSLLDDDLGGDADIWGLIDGVAKLAKEASNAERYRQALEAIARPTTGYQCWRRACAAAALAGEARP